MNAPRFKATLADGTVIAGAVRGRGGFIRALSVLLGAQALHAHGRHLTGRVTFYPHYSAAHDGPGVEVPLAGTTFEDNRPALTVREVRADVCARCGRSISPRDCLAIAPGGKGALHQACAVAAATHEEARTCGGGDHAGE